MIRILAAILAAAIGLPQLITPAVAAPAQGAVTWTVDHQAKTITARVQLQIYSGCESEACSAVNSAAATQFIAEKIKAQAEGVWNRGYFYRCYQFILDVHVKVGRGSRGIDKDRVGVMIDPSFAGIRDHVSGSGSKSDWDSNDPSASQTPEQEGSTWSEQSQYEATTYAHEVGHVLGLDDHYHDETNTAGEEISVPNEGAPVDLMSSATATNIDQSTINRVVERNRNNLRDAAGGAVSLDDLECPEFMATLDGKQVDHKGSAFRFDGCQGSTVVTKSEDQTVAFFSDKVHVDAAKVEPPIAAWVGLEYVLVPHGKKAADLPLLTGPIDEPTLFQVPATFSVDRSNNKPGLAPMPSVLDTGAGGCAGGDVGGGGGQRDDCGHREYHAMIAVTLTRVTVVRPQIENGTPDPDSLYESCGGPTPIPGLFALQGGGTITGGSVDVTKLLDPNVDKIDITGTMSVTIKEPGRWVTTQYDWLLQLCRIRDGQPAC